MTVFDLIWSLAGFVVNVAAFLGDLISGLFGLINNVWGMVTILLSLLPSEVAALLIIGLTISAGYTVYSWVKDIEIAGFKL